MAGSGYGEQMNVPSLVLGRSRHGKGLSAYSAMAFYAATCVCLGLCVGCWPGAPAATSLTTPPNCGDSRCDPLQEDCLRCPQDCSCCTIISAKGALAGQAEALVEGEADTKTMTLREGDQLEMAFARGLIDAQNSPDLQIVGSLQSSNTVDLSERCVSRSGGRGGVEVYISTEGQAASWRLLGVWGRDSQGHEQTAFDFGCANLADVRWVRLQVQPGALAQLDAVTAYSDAQGHRPSCPAASTP